MSNSSQKSKTQNFYDRIADVHNLLMQVNGYRNSVANFLKSMELELDKNSLVLDAGSGTGIVTSAFYRAGFLPQQTIAYDLSFNLLKVSREELTKDRKIAARNISPVQGNVLNFPFADETFDLVLTCGVLEYVPLEEGLSEMARVLKKGAKLVLIPIKPSFVGTVLEFLYKFKTHPIEDVRQISHQYFNIVGDYQFPITEPIGWSKMIFLLEKK